MKEWFAASKLAGMPGLPGTDRAVQIKAKRNDWQKQKRQGRGGGWEYHISSLPAETQAHIQGEILIRIKPSEIPASKRRIVRFLAWLLRPVIREAIREERP